MVNLKKNNVIKEEIITRISIETGYSQRLVGNVVETLLKDIMQEMASGNKVQFAGFGTFEPKEMAERTGRNLNTNEPVTIPARIVPSFKPGNRMKEAVIREKC